MANEPVITVVGNLTADPDLKYLSTGVAVASFTVAVTPRTFNKQANQYEDGEAMFFRCSVWRDYAENVANSLSKGMRVVVNGKLQVRTYQRNDGTQGTSLEIQADEVSPSLRFATAQVMKSVGGSRGGFQDGANAGGYAAPSNSGAAFNPWEDDAQGASFSPEPPY